MDTMCGEHDPHLQYMQHASHHMDEAPFASRVAEGPFSKHRVVRTKHHCQGDGANHKTKLFFCQPMIQRVPHASVYLIPFGHNVEMLKNQLT